MSSPTGVLYLLSFLLAFCSLTYELVFAQILSVCLGGTKYQYLLTISLFTCALGIGSLLFGLLKKRIQILRLLILIEILLTIFGALGPFFITWVLRIKEETIFNQYFYNFISYFVVFFVGLLSGFELPCLFSISGNFRGKVLASDYLGMLTGSLFFPLIGLPLLGTAGTALAASNLNLIALFFIRPFESKMTNFLFLSINFISLCAIITYREELNGILTSIYLIGV